jgi:N-acetylmuramoyl-L-alanine amidase
VKHCKKALVLICALICTDSLFLYAQTKLNITEYPVTNARREELTRQYAQTHYGINSYTLKDPKIIVVHYTVTHNLKETFAMFKKDTLEGTRPELIGGGNVNVGVHYVIDRDGSLYSLLPETMMGRHTIGFNHLSLGIEMVGMSSRDLSNEQLESCALLVSYLAREHTSVKYLIGHHEYLIKALPHYALFTERDAKYKPTIKIDPGEAFMHQLRVLLKNKYSLVLEK